MSHQLRTIVLPGVPSATASLFIVSPLAGSEGLSHLFSTHPPMREWVSRLPAMALQPCLIAA